MRPVLAARLLLVALGLSFARGELLAVTITVTNTNDGGAGSFRDAIDASNASVGVFDTIAFAIAGGGVHTISLATSPPTITDPVIIDGTTQPGYAGSPLIEITAGAPLGNGIRITAGGSTVRALVVNGFSAQISLGTGGGNLVEGCYVGTDPTGTVDLSVGDGVYIQASDGNTIGGTSAGAGNLVSGNGGSGVHIITGDANVIQGNRIGTTADGTGALENGTGVTLVLATNTLVGGAAAGARNVISGNTNGNGLYVVQSGAGNRILGNFIGTDISGTMALPNNFGIDAALTESIDIGGPAPGEGNVISGNNQAIILNNGIAGSVIQGNLIGTDPTGTLPVPNNLSILLNTLDTTNVVIGGPGAGEGNVIAFNQGYPSLGGILFTGGIWNLGLRVTIRGNSIHDNFGIGIDNSDGTLGVTPNDPGDSDTGVGNEFQNFPIVTTVTGLVGPQGTDTRFQGILHSAPSTTYTLDFYANPACARFPREFIEGETYLGFGQVATDGAGTGIFDVTLPVVLDPAARVTATATDPAGNTSEFSQRIVFAILPTSGPPAGGTAVALAGTDFAAGATVTIGGVAASGVNVGSSTQIGATSPALPAGTVNDVTVVNLDGSAGTLPKGFVSDFLDVPSSNIFYPSVTTLVSNTITVGVGGGLYGVNQPTLRQQMAVFLLKAKFGLCYVPPACTGTFPDVPCPSTFANWIEALAAEGITGGCGGGNYCPGNPVRRDQMAVFLLKAEHGSNYVPPPCAGTFPDVACPSAFADWIEHLAAEQITGGCGGGNYCPQTNNTRGQMAVFIVKTFKLQ